MANSGTTITGTLILGALTLKASDLVKYLLATIKQKGQTRSEGINGLLSLGITAALGVLIVTTVAQTQWASEIPIGSQQLGKLSTLSLVVLGLVISSFGSTLYDLKKAIDRTESSSTPRVTESAEARRVTALETYFDRVADSSDPDA